MTTKNDLTQDLETLYAKIHSEGQEAILNGQEKIDPILNHLEMDRRRGLTLLITLQDKNTDNFQRMIDKIHEIEPEQYFYPLSDLHVTILDLISATNDFIKDDKKIQDLTNLVENTVEGFSAFSIDFTGIITSNAAILAKGFYGCEMLQLRNQLRKNAIARGIDLHERYQSLSAHSTIVRFKSNLQRREKLWATIQRYQDFKFGVFQVKELELVIHDWYNREKEIIRKYPLKNKS